MDATQAPGTTDLVSQNPEDIQRQLGKIVHSKVFRHCSALQRLLQYLVAKAASDPYGEIKEYTIGVEVFDRGHNYDPQNDTIVRVQIHRLRQKVKEYYESEGINDPILVEIPKGHYIPAFESRPNASMKTSEAEAPAEVAAAPVREHLEEAESAPAAAIEGGLKATEGYRFFPRGVALSSLVLLVFVAGTLLGTRWEQSRTLAESDPSLGGAGSIGAGGGDAAETFWRGFRQPRNSRRTSFGAAVCVEPRTGRAGRATVLRGREHGNRRRRERLRSDAPLHTNGIADDGEALSTDDHRRLETA